MSSHRLFLTTFGTFGVCWDRRELPGFGSGKLAALLAYLAVEPGPQRREALAELLWPQVSAEAARLSLRQALFNLRNLLQEETGHAFLVAGRHQVAFDRNAPFQVDTATFLDASDACNRPNAEDCAEYLPTLSAAIDLYKGPFLGNLDLPDSPAFMDWLQFKRESFHRRALELLLRSIECHEARGSVRAALSFALRYKELEPWSERGYLQAMRLYAADRQCDAALALYETCRRVLERDLGVLPGEEIQALAERLRRQGSPHEEPAAPMPLIEERRQVTVLFCELHAMDAFDPEEVLERLREPQARCVETIRALGGHTVQTHGGGLLAYFGYPQALENTALYGVRAGRRIAATATPEMEVRVGVHSGPIVTMANSSVPDPIGMTSNVAIQLRAKAESGDTVVSDETRRKVAGYFRFSSLGRCKLRGIAQAMELFRVEEASGVTHRLDATSRLTPLIGRETEQGMLDRAWMQAHGGKFQALLLSGEAGIGKSRLVRHLADRVASGRNMVYELRCFPETRQSPMYPIVKGYRTMAGFKPDDTPKEKLGKLEELLRRRTALAERALPLLAHLLDLPTEEPPPKSNAALHAVLVDVLHDVATRNPVLLVLEDAHWADASTLDFISLLCSHRPAGPLLVLLTARPEFEPERISLDRIQLLPLDNEAVGAIVASLRADMPPEQVAKVVARADGIPLYAEELAALATDDELPANLLDLLTARLDALGATRAVAQLAACVGREIDEEFLGMISDMPEDARRAAVGAMLSSGLVQRIEDRRLQFKHALVQEAAYRSQSKAQRAATHRRIAQTLEDGYGDLVSQHPEIPARHWSAAGETTAAIRHWLAAGRHATWNYAYREAASHYAEGLALLPKMAEGPDRNKLEFALLVNLARAEQVFAGYGNARSMASMERAIALLDTGVGDGVDLFHALWGQWEASGSQSGHGKSLEIAHRLLALAEKENSRSLMQKGHYVVGNSLFWMGSLAEARAGLERSIALEEDAKNPVRDFYGRNIPLAARCYLSWTLWQQGETERALALSDETLHLAKRHEVPFDQAFASFFAVILRRWQGDIDAVTRLAEQGYALAAACQSPPFMAVQKMHQGWVAVMNGDTGALALLEKMVDVVRQSMSGGAMVMLAPFVEILLRVGQVEKALIILDEALHHSERKQDRHYLPELHRLKGECLLAQGDPVAARACFETALAVGEAQGALAFIQRARRSLAISPVAS